MPSIDEFRSALRSQFRDAESRGATFIEINSGQLHRKLGGYPSTRHQMPSCCEVMYGEQVAGDEVLSRPPKGKGASLTIRYRLPRQQTSVPKPPRIETCAAAAEVPSRPAPEPVHPDHPRLTIASYEFEQICELAPYRNPDGTVRQFMPQDRYKNLWGILLNKYGKGPFCKFQIPTKIETSGVYVITIDHAIRYVGECENFSTRFNAGYGNISPRNCFVGGQDTNCRLNNLVYSAAVAGETVLLWFFKTTDYKTVEAELRSTLRPPWNRI
jgi:hypothetical protein